MSSTRRLTSGSAIQITTGTLRGIGPVGPKGPTGPVGPRGVDGPVGPQGETGVVSRACTDARLTSELTIPANGNVTMQFDSVVVDELDVVASLTNIRLDAANNYYLSAHVTISNTTGTPTGTRMIELLEGSNVLASNTIALSSTSVDVSLNLATGIRATDPNLVYTIRVSSTDTSPSVLTGGRVFISPHGPGVQGPVGPKGATGEPGPRGIQGPVGPPGGDVEGVTFNDLKAVGA